MNRRPQMFDRESVPRLASNCVHVWSLSTCKHDNLEEFAEVLSPEECARAETFHFEKDRRTFVICRGTLRRLISFYTGLSAEQIGFCVGPQGKPSLKKAHASDLRFNVSHSGDIALLAFSGNQEIGVDVELKRAEIDFVLLAEMSFSKDERAALLACAPTDRANLFYEFWTCKEACIKADGRGLSVPLDEFSVATRGVNSQWREIIAAGSGFITSGMRSRVLDIGEDYAAAVVTNLRSWQVLQLDMECAQIYERA